MVKSLDLIGISRKRALAHLITGGYKNINDFCTKTGEDYAAIYRYLNKNIKIGDKVISRLAKIFEKSPEYFDTYMPNIKSVDIPIIDCNISKKTTLSEMLANSRNSAMIEDKLLNNYGWKKEALFIVIAQDNSMEPLIRDKSEVIVDSSQTQIENNKIYVVKINASICIRKLIKSPITGAVSLIPENTPVFPIDEVKSSNDFQVLGKVVYLKIVL
jgi:hypothetical protein